jgi:hypothetical protein
MELLIMVQSLAMVIVMFASIAAILIWLLMELLRALARLPSRLRRSRQALTQIKDQWDPRHPSHFKRAGQW